MYEEKEEGDMLSEAQRISEGRKGIGTEHKWKPPVPARPDETTLYRCDITAQENKASADAGNIAQVCQHTTYRVGSTVRSVFAASQLLGTAAGQKDILEQIARESLTALLFVGLGMLAALLGICVTIREWIHMIQEALQNRRRREVIRRLLVEEDNRIRIQLPTVRPRNVIYTHPEYPNARFSNECPVSHSVKTSLVETARFGCGSAALLAATTLLSSKRTAAAPQ